MGDLKEEMKRNGVWIRRPKKGEVFNGKIFKICLYKQCFLVFFSQFGFVGALSNVSNALK